MLHSRYSFTYVLKLPIAQITKLLINAYEKQSEEKAWQLYLTKYQHMTEENYVPFDEFYKPKRVEETNKSAENILAEVREMMNSNDWR